MVHTSCGLLLMVSQSTQNTALRRGTAVKAASVSPAAFIFGTSYSKRCEHAKFGFLILHNRFQKEIHDLKT
jgi:drug/metabolite transporter (DMT)-like permease